MLTGVDAASDQTLIAEYLTLIRDMQSTLYMIARHAEFNDQNPNTEIQIKAERAINLIDSYILASQIENGQAALDLSTFGLGSVMHGAATELRTICGQEIGIKVGVNYPVYTNKELVNNFLVTCGQFISSSVHTSVMLRSFIAKDGSVGVGAFSRNFDLNTKLFRQGVKSVGRIPMPMPKVSNSSGVMLVLAGKIADILGGDMYVKHLGVYTGLAIKLPKSEQLKLWYM